MQGLPFDGLVHLLEGGGIMVTYESLFEFVLVLVGVVTVSLLIYRKK